MRNIHDKYYATRDFQVLLHQSAILTLLPSPLQARIRGFGECNVQNGLQSISSFTGVLGGVLFQPRTVDAGHIGIIVRYETVHRSKNGVKRCLQTKHCWCK